MLEIKIEAIDNSLAEGAVIAPALAEHVPDLRGEGLGFSLGLPATVRRVGTTNREENLLA